MSSSLLMDFLCRRSGPFTSFVPGTFEAAYRPSSLTAQKSQVPSRLKRDGICLFLLGISRPGYRQLAAVAYRATNASGVYGGAGIGIVPVPLLRTASAPTSGSAGRVAGVAYLTLKVHVPPPGTGAVQPFAVTEYNPPMLTRRFSAVICTGAVPLLVTVTTLVTGARSVGIVKVRVRTPATVPSVPLVAEVKVTVPTFTVNVTVLLGPAGVVTLTVLAERVAVFEIVKVVVTVVEVTVKAPTVIPVPDTFTAVAPVRFVPVKVTETMVPRVPDVGAIEVSVGTPPAVVATNSTAPASTNPFFLRVPKKSVAGAWL